MIKLAFVLLALFLSGCIYVPKQVTYFDDDCTIYLKKMTMEKGSKGFGKGFECENESCLGTLAVLGVVSAGSVLVSGSIVVTANTVYWLEKQARCS